MRIVLLALACAAVSAMAAPPAGRWMGQLQIPGRTLPVVVDLAKDSSGAWIGSLTMPGFEVKGAALGHVKVAGNSVSFDAGRAIGSPEDPATFSGKVEKDRIVGQFHQGGNTAPFQVKYVGEAQVDLPATSTAVSHALEGRWVGTYELGGYPRQVTVDIANQAGTIAKVDFVVVGKMTTKLPIDFVSEKDGTFRVEATPYRITYEGVIAHDAIKGTLVQGPIEVPLVLRRSPEKAS